MVWIPGGTFTMGSDSHYPEERLTHQVTVTGFWMDQYQVTNREYERFVNATGYQTVTERIPEPSLYPGAPPEALVPGWIMFRKPKGRVNLNNYFNWWKFEVGISWRTPQGLAVWRENYASIQWCTLLMRMPLRMRSRQGKNCHRKHSGNLLPVVAWRGALMSGVKNLHSRAK